MKQRIQPDNDYWQYDGKPLVLIGGSVEDNLFQIPDLEAHLDRLLEAGGNYVRCSMSSRDEGNVWPFAMMDNFDELYDLNMPGDEYWRRFAEFLRLTYERDIIVQIEVWETFDFYREPWSNNPFNPKNNINYTGEDSGLPTVILTHPTKTENPFFWSIPAEHNNITVLDYQHQFVDQLLSHSLQYPHILYCMDNETSVTAEWGKYWAEYIQGKALEIGLSVEVTEMWDPHDLSHPMHNATFDHPETYSFVDISQNNHQVGQTHWDNAQKTRQRIHSLKVRPINNVKIYGSDAGRYGTTSDGIDRFWRNIFGKLAAARFHRPDSGIGLSDEAYYQIKSMRMLLNEIDVIAGQPNNQLLLNRTDDAAYCIADLPNYAAVYFPRPGEIAFDASGFKSGKLRLRWLNTAEAAWLDDVLVDRADVIQLVTPLPGKQALLITSGV